MFDQVSIYLWFAQTLALLSDILLPPPSSPNISLPLSLCPAATLKSVSESIKSMSLKFRSSNFKYSASVAPLSQVCCHCLNWDFETFFWWMKTIIMGIKSWELTPPLVNFDFPTWISANCNAFNRSHVLKTTWHIMCVPCIHLLREKHRDIAPGPKVTYAYFIWSKYLSHKPILIPESRFPILFQDWFK